MSSTSDCPQTVSQAESSKPLCDAVELGCLTSIVRACLYEYLDLQSIDFFCLFVFLGPIKILGASVDGCSLGF